MEANQEDLIVTSTSGDAIHIFKNVNDFIRYQDKYRTGFQLSQVEAQLILEYHEGHGYALGLRKGVLYRGDKEDTYNKIVWEKTTMDDVIDSVCEWNYEFILDHNMLNRIYENELPNEGDAYYKKLKDDEVIFDRLFEQTKYGAQTSNFAKTLADAFIAQLNKGKNLDESVDKLVSGIRTAVSLPIATRAR